MNLTRPLPRGARSPARPDGGRQRLRFLARNRYQLAGAVAFAVLLPAMVRSGLTPWHHFLGSMENTIIGTLVAMLLGAYLMRRMASYPGMRTLSCLLPAFFASYGIAMAVFFFLRLDYSRFQFLASFILAIAWFGFVGLIEPRIRRPHLVVVPFGSARKVMRCDQADWQIAEMIGELPAGSSGIVADLRADLSDEWERYLAQASLAGIPVYHWKQINESLTGTVEIEQLSENTLGSLLPSSIYLRVKHGIDLLAAFAVLPAVVLVAGVIALVIYFEDGGPVIFRQRRIGRGGREFVMYKFRTMRPDAGEPFTLADDPRVTRSGRFLRRYRLDELLQIVNVLKGDMSWIGPRPEALKLAQWYESQIPFYSYRHIVRPGITGWAQVNQGNVAEIEAATGKLHYDFYYIKYFSPWLDLLIAVKTLRIVLTGYGAR